MPIKKDNKKYWFEPKMYGWGFVPSTLEGWAVTLVLLIITLIIVDTNGILDGTLTAKGSLRTIFDIFVVTTIFSLLMKDKVRGGLGWRWRNKKKR